MMKQGRLGYNSSNGRYGLLSSDLWIDTGFHCGEGLEVLVGDESGKRMVSGGNALLWRFGICAGEDTRINRSMIHFSVGAEQTSIRTLCPGRAQGDF